VDLDAEDWDGVGGATEKGGGTFSDAKNPGFLEVFPRLGKRQPLLLENLEAFLEDQIAQAERMAATEERVRHVDRDEGVTANMRLDAHRQCFQAFIQAFTTYRPLLTRIKNEYDHALDVALRSECENSQMRLELSQAEARQARMVQEVRAQSAAEAAASRAELHQLLEAMERRAEAAETKAAAAERERDEALVASAEAQEKADSHRAANADLKKLMLEESSWAKKPIAGKLGEKVLEPMSTTQAGPAEVE